MKIDFWSNVYHHGTYATGLRKLLPGVVKNKLTTVELPTYTTVNSDRFNSFVVLSPRLLDSDISTIPQGYVFVSSRFEV